METLRTNLPHESLPLPIELFQNEIGVLVWIILVALLYRTYVGWKTLESDSTPRARRQPIKTSPAEFNSRISVWMLFEQVRRLAPSDENFGEWIARLFLQYAELSLHVKVPPTLTAREARRMLPSRFADVLEEIRDIRYAPKHSVEGKCRLVQTSVLALMESHGIR